MGEPLHVRDIMISAVTTIPLESTLLDAALLMRRCAIRHLPVVEGERLVGIITERDINRCAPSLLSPITQEEYNAIFENTPIARIMSRGPRTISPSTSARDALAYMLENRLGCLPVIEDERLVGMLTRSDMLGVLLNLLTSQSVPSV